jgi:hypothetical protein
MRGYPGAWGQSMKRYAPERAEMICDDAGEWVKHSDHEAALAATVADAERYRDELMNIANAKRFDRKCFDDDKAFASWAQSRARFQINAARKEGV